MMVNKGNIGIYCVLCVCVVKSCVELAMFCFCILGEKFVLQF
jgi:hypothetical protein